MYAVIDWYEWNRDGEVYGVAAAMPRNRESLLTSNCYEVTPDATNPVKISFRPASC
jgi:hypothetical protein